MKFLIWEVKRWQPQQNIDGAQILHNIVADPNTPVLVSGVLVPLLNVIASNDNEAAQELFSFCQEFSCRLSYKLQKEMCKERSVQ